MKERYKLICSNLKSLLNRTALSLISNVFIVNISSIFESQENLNQNHQSTEQRFERQILIAYEISTVQAYLKPQLTFRRRPKQYLNDHRARKRFTVIFLLTILRTDSCNGECKLWFGTTHTHACTHTHLRRFDCFSFS